VDVGARALVADIRAPGRTRWATFDAESRRFYVNAADPPQIIAVDGADPPRIAAAWPMPAAGPHGLELDPATRRLFCACDAKVLPVIDVFDTEAMRRLERVPTEAGAHTIGLDAGRNTVYAFLPKTHRAAVYRDAGSARS
jgi:hypothetical protein